MKTKICFVTLLTLALAACGVEEERHSMSSNVPPSCGEACNPVEDAGSPDAPDVPLPLVDAGSMPTADAGSNPAPDAGTQPTADAGTEPEPDPEPECESDEDCGDGCRCNSAGECEPQPEEPSSDAGTEPEPEPDSGIVPTPDAGTEPEPDPEPECESDADCDPDSQCNAGMCEPKPEEPPPPATLPAPFRVAADGTFEFSTFYNNGSPCGEVLGNLPGISWWLGEYVTDANGDAYLEYAHASIPNGSYAFSYIDRECGTESTQFYNLDWANYGAPAMLKAMTPEARSYVFCNWYDSAAGHTVTAPDTNGDGKPDPGCEFRISVDGGAITADGNMQDAVL